MTQRIHCKGITTGCHLSMQATSNTKSKWHQMMPKGLELLRTSYSHDQSAFHRTKVAGFQLEIGRIRSNPSTDWTVEWQTRRYNRVAPSLNVILPKTTPGTQDDTPGLMINHQVLSLYGYQSMCATEKYKTSPPPSTLPANDDSYRQVHPAMMVNYMTFA